MKIVLDTEKCSGCRICELVCSAYHEGVFSPQKTHIKIIDHYTLTGREKGIKSCNLCAGCVDVCPVNAITINGKWLTIDEDLCSGCGQCVDACPERVIFLNSTGVAAVPDFCEGNPSCVQWCPRQALSLEE